jgi:hypothetical protein
MIALPCPQTNSMLSGLQNAFISLLPKIQKHAQISFRHLACADQRADRMAESVALAWKWFLRLDELGKDVNQFPMVFIYLVVKGVRSGRRLAGQERQRDILSKVAQVRNDFLVESLSEESEPVMETTAGRHGSMRRVVKESLQANTHTSIPEQVAFRLDWHQFFRSLPARDRRMIKFLSVGHRPERAALQFGVSRTRVSQLRKKWRRQWRAFRG